MRALNRWESIGVILSSVGVVDSAYLTINAFFPALKLACPTTGVINCEGVTGSPYSHLLGVIPVALLALLWFGLVIILIGQRPSGFAFAMIISWAAALVMVGYLVSVEVFILHEVCLYCTLAHVCAMLLGAPILKLALREI